MVFYVYLAGCYKKGKLSCYYCGQTNNLRRRIGEHIELVRNKDTSHYAGRFDFFKLAWFCKVDTRSDALVLEREIKDLDHTTKDDLVHRRVDIRDLIEFEDEDEY